MGKPSGRTNSRKKMRADLSLAGLLSGSPIFVPPPGVARIHRLGDEEKTDGVAAGHGGASSMKRSPRITGE